MDYLHGKKAMLNVIILVRDVSAMERKGFGLLKCTTWPSLGKKIKDIWNVNKTLKMVGNNYL